MWGEACTRILVRQAYWCSLQNCRLSSWANHCLIVNRNETRVDKPHAKLLKMLYKSLYFVVRSWVLGLGRGMVNANTLQILKMKISHDLLPSSPTVSIKGVMLEVLRKLHQQGNRVCLERALYRCTYTSIRRTVIRYASCVFFACNIFRTPFLSARYLSARLLVCGRDHTI